METSNYLSSLVVWLEMAQLHTITIRGDIGKHQEKLHENHQYDPGGGRELGGKEAGQEEEEEDEEPPC